MVDWHVHVSNLRTIKKTRQYSSLEQWNCFHGGCTEIAKLKNIWVVIILLATLELNGYFRYKTITPQSLLSEAKVKIFLYRRNVIFPSQDIPFSNVMFRSQDIPFSNVMFRSQDIQVFVVLTIPRFSKSVTS